ncbi:MAG TPA: hypothetical protein VIQ22_03675 [Gammaproteobacteria bacterium]
MHSINVHIDETLKATDIDALRRQLLQEPYVSNVEMRTEMPHDMLVEFEAHHAIPQHVLDMLKARGFHADIVGC